MLLRIARTTTIASIIALSLAACSTPGTTESDSNTMSFFLTSQNPGNGAQLGGLAGADAYCATLAATAGVPSTNWKAYLSSSDINARDRIGSGPWVNANGVTIAQNVDDLHSENNLLNKQNAVSESGQVINGRGDTPNRHDILTGSDASGNATASTCDNWTSNGAGSATVGHHDRTGGGAAPTSWNAAHESQGCGMEALQATGGDGLFYCFAE